jgi:hypothetical protein
MDLTIPERHKPALANLVGRSAAQVKAIAGAIARAKPTASLFDLTVQISDAETGLDFADLRSIVEMLASLYRVRKDLDATAQDMADALISLAQNRLDIKPKAANWNAIREQLVRIFEADKTLGLTAKASELYFDNERTLCAANCRVFTDIRPIFLGAVDSQPSGAIIQHSFKIAYHKDDDLRHVYVSLDPDDIDYLRDLLDRASAKGKSIRRTMDKSGIPMLGTAAELDGEDK